MIIVANGADTNQNNRKVTPAEGQEVSETFGCPIFETIGNNPNNKGITESFTEIIREVYLIYKSKTATLELTPLAKEAKQRQTFRYSRVDTNEIKFSKSLKEEELPVEEVNEEELDSSKA